MAKSRFTFIRHCFPVVIVEQDAGLEALSNVIAQQKNMALGIGDEIESQNGEISSPINESLLSEGYGHGGPGVCPSDGQTEAYLRDTGMTGLASAWVMARRRPI